MATIDIGDLLRKVKPKTILIIVISVVVIIVIISSAIGHWFGSRTSVEIKKQVEEAVAKVDSNYKVKIDELNKKVVDKEKAVKDSEARYGKLVDAIGHKIQEAEEIKKPGSEDEITKGFNKHGFSPIIHK